MYDLYCISVAIVINFLYSIPERREKEETMKCENCGMELEEDQTVCPVCNPEVTPEEKPARKTMKQRKKEKILKITLSVIAGILVVALVVGLVLIGMNDGWGRENNIYRKDSYGASEFRAKLARNTVVATAGNYKLTNAQLQVLYAMQILDFANTYGDYLEYLDISIDLEKPLGDQVYDEQTGLTWEKLFLQEALAEWLEYCAVGQKAKENLFELPQEFTDHMSTLKETIQKSAKEGGYSSVDAMLQKDLGTNVAYDDYYNYLLLYYTHNLYAEELMERVKISSDDLEKYFAENEKDLKDNYGVTKESGDYVDVRHILITPKGGTKSEDGKTTTYSDAEWEACRAAAQAVYDEWLAGEKTEDSFGKLANEKSEDQNGNVTNGGLYENVTQGQMVTEFNDWCFETGRNPGDHGLVKTEFGYHIMYFVNREAVWTRYCRAGIQNQEVQKTIEEYAKMLECNVDYSAIVLDELELS